MAVYFLRSKHISRSNGSRVTRAAAYRAGERIRNEATSEVFDFSSRSDIPYKEIVLPADLAGRDDMAWTQDCGTLWNAAEHAGLRCNSRLAREWLVFLPPTREVSADGLGARTRLEVSGRRRYLLGIPERTRGTDAPEKPPLQPEGIDPNSPQPRGRGLDFERWGSL
jgi:MobA/MobL family